MNSIHGTEHRYRRGCRCEDCARGHREARRRERAKLPDNLKPARDCTKHPVCCQLCEDLEWLLTNGETLPIVALRLGLSEETAAHHIRRYLPGLGVDQ